MCCVFCCPVYAVFRYFRSSLVRYEFFLLSSPDGMGSSEMEESNEWWFYKCATSVYVGTGHVHGVTWFVWSSSLLQRRLPHPGLCQTNKWNDSVAQQEIATGEEDHRDPKNPDHSTSPVLCRIMSSYSQVWNPWRVEGGIVTNSFFTRFTYRFVSLCYPLICRTDTCVKYCFVSCFFHRFICRFVIVSNIVSTIYMFEYTVYIVDIELY